MLHYYSTTDRIQIQLTILYITAFLHPRFRWEVTIHHRRYLLYRLSGGF